MKRTADVVIVGGGCMGASLAYHLARRGVTDAVLVEREALLGAGSTGRNAGGVRHQFSHETNVRLSIESIRMFERFEEEVGQPVDFRQDGYLFLLSTDAHVETFRHAVAMQRRLGVEVEWLDPAEAARHAPGLVVDGVRAATFCARDGIADPHGVTMGFASAAQRMGVTIERDAEVVGIRLDRGRVASAETSRGTIACHVVVDAAGPWAALVGRLAGVTLPIEPLRRHIFVAAPPTCGGWEHGGPGGTRAAPASHIMVIDFDTSFYFHREGPNLLFGMGDPDERPGFDTTVNWAVLEKVTPVAVRRLPVLAEVPITRAWAGLYEMTPDGMPIIGPAGGIEGFYVIAGFSGHGFQHSPAAGRVLADLIVGRDPQIDLEPFAADRFARGEREGERGVV